MSDLRAVNTSGWTEPWANGVDIVDRYSGFDHRIAEGQGPLVTPPVWLSDTEDIRRILSYRVAKAAQEGVVRFFHDREGLAPDFDQNREHGHAAALVERVVDAILGEGASIRVPGADVAVPPRPVLPRKPDPLPEGADEADRLVDEAVQGFYLEQVRRAVEEWKVQAEEHDKLTARQDAFDRWATDTQFWEAIYENESEHVAPLGDGVLELSIDSSNRPKVRAIHPAAFVKRWSEGSTGDFPDRVHLAWEVQRSTGQGGLPETWLRRVTYELLDVQQSWTPAYQSAPTSVRCFWSDAEWNLSDLRFSYVGNGSRLKSIDIDDLPTERATFRMVEHPFDPAAGKVAADQLPLPIDFIPVTHVKNTLGRWGRSVFARIMPLLDDMVAADTSAALVAVLCGEPPIMVSGGVISEDLVLGAAALLDMGSEGKGAKLGFADELRALIEYNGMLERQFIKMTSLSSELSGRENREQSGRAIGLKMTPFRQAILRGRLARQATMDLTLKFVQRLAIVAGTEGFEGEVMPAELKWGTFIPEDLSELVERITLLRDRGLLTDGDVYDLLTAAGMNVKDVDASLEELRSMNVRVAEPLMRVVGRKAAAEFLNRDYDEDDPSLAENAPQPAPFGGSGSRAPEPGSARANPGSGDRNGVGPRRERSSPVPRP